MKGCLKVFGQKRLIIHAMVNQSLSKVFNTKVTKVWTGKEVDFSSLKVFGCPTYAHIPSDERPKLDSKSLKCILLGFKTRVKG